MHKVPLPGTIFCNYLYGPGTIIMIEVIEVTAYQEALDYLYKFVDYSQTRAFRFSPEKFNLERMRVFLALLGDPHLAYPVIHVAGTKGKGSVSALLASVLREAGYRVGLYTSPHLHDFTERIQVDGLSIPRLDFAHLVNLIKPFVDRVPDLTTFELTTALGFLYFQRRAVDVAVIEVGLGGRLDATNVVQPLLSVITSLSMDHMSILGDTLVKIAAEKAGIIKPGRPVVSSPQKSEAQAVVEEVAAQNQSRLTQVGKDFFYAPREHSLNGQSLFVWPADQQALVDRFVEADGLSAWQPLRLTIPLLGYHQAVNAATAFAAIDTASREGFEIPPDAIQRGFANVVWPGRFEVLQKDPLVIVDSAHNPDSALKLRLALDDYLGGEPAILVFGASEDKDISGMFAELLPRVDRVIATRSIHPRAMDPEEIVKISHHYGCKAEAVVPLGKALMEAVELAGTQAAVIAAGSLFVAAAVRETWQMNHPEVRLLEREKSL